MADKFVYTYRDEQGNPSVHYLKDPARKCPNCGAKELKDKGSFSKCMKCGERIVDSTPLEIGFDRPE